jgi:hypothetical protein
MKRTPLSRRTVLRGVLGGAAITVALPPLEAFFNTSGTALASGAPLPKRFGLFFWGNGVVPDDWVPAATGASYTLSKLLAPLASLQDAITVVSGMKVQTPNVEPHISGAAGILSGGPLLVSNNSKTFMGPTIDQVIAASIGTKTRFKSIEFGAAPGSGNSFNGPNNQNPPESSPAALFDRIFGSGFSLPGQGGPPDPMLAVRRSILDVVMKDAQSLRGKLGATDKARIDQHLEGIRELEQRITAIQSSPPDLKACQIPMQPATAYPDVDGRPALSAINRALTDVVALAVACDQTRVFSNYFTSSVNNLLFPGAPSGHHQLTHDEPNDQPNVQAIMVQIIQELAYFLGKLRSISEGDGTVLDHCAILATTDCSFGRTHALDDFPIVLAGSANGVLKTGLHYRSTTAENTSKVLLSLIRAMDITIGSFGFNEGSATDSLGAIES